LTRLSSKVGDRECASICKEQQLFFIGPILAKKLSKEANESTVEDIRDFLKNAGVMP